MSLRAQSSSDLANHQSTPSSRVTLLVAVWATSVSIGLMGLALYANSPGKPAIPPERWPDTSQLSLHPEHPTLLFFVHPRCFCTRSSTRELETVISRNEGRLFVQAVVVQPRDPDKQWRATPLVRHLEQLPESNLRVDTEGKETRTFGVSTSGQVLVYSPEGRLLFSGGVTGARGHSGHNLGIATLNETLSLGEPGSSKCCDVYGCPLFPLAGSQETSP